MTNKVRVVILDDHPSIVDGYRFRLLSFPQIEIVATVDFGEDLEPIMATHPADVLIMDVSVPTSPYNISPYPILHLVPKLLQTYPKLNVLVISMLAERGLIRAVVEAGASGYLLKDDQSNMHNLGKVLLSVAQGEICFSGRAEALLRNLAKPDDMLSPRQLEALSLALAYPQYTTDDLAQRMSVANSTVRNILSNAYLKLGVRTRAEALIKARQLGLITPDPPPYSH